MSNTVEAHPAGLIRNRGLTQPQNGNKLHHQDFLLPHDRLERANLP